MGTAAEREEPHPKVELLRGLWPNLIGEDKQQMKKSLLASSTCRAACADIYRRGQINTHVLRDKTPVRGLVACFKRTLTHATEQESQGRQAPAWFSRARLTRNGQINAQVLRYTLRYLAWQ